MTLDYIALGNNIRKVRKASGITQEKLAEYVDVSTVFISQIENAARKASLETIYKISCVLETPIDDFLVGSEGNVLPKIIAELILLLGNRTDIEIGFILDIVKSVLVNLHDEKITLRKNRAE